MCIVSLGGSLFELYSYDSVVFGLLALSSRIFPLTFFAGVDKCPRQKG
jgi:hypothetical protein